MEIIGRLLMMTFLIGIAACIGLAVGLAVFVILRKAERPWRVPTVQSPLFPPAAMLYLLICLVASSALSSVIGTPDLVFGDINEALPNGFYLRALDKMPNAGLIENPDNPRVEVAWVSDL